MSDSSSNANAVREEMGVSMHQENGKTRLLTLFRFTFRRQDVAGDGCDTDDDGEYGDPYEAYDSSGDETLGQDNAGLHMDSQYFMPSSVQLYITVGCMMMSSRIDFFNPTFVRLVRCVRAVDESLSDKVSNSRLACRFAFIIQIMIQVRNVVVDYPVLIFMSISFSVIAAIVCPLRSPGR